MTTQHRVSPGALAPDVARLLARADAEIIAANLAADPAERFVHAHLGALRAAAAVVALRGRPSARSRARSVWDLLAVVEPGLAAWSVYFAGGARIRAAVDAGRFDAVDPGRAEEIMVCAEDFRDEVAMIIDPDAGFVRHPTLRVVAS
ncbi:MULTISPECIES: SAV_6107 family HEPN domain-containing protein [Oerskovia]|uniref:Colicin transporter n=1 Tax=Oerskovia merdavium TaxID=2762227 RepID=A0ABR8U118_9CELL|nr:SAV_6107 family HEPN domain-containing protein [Oerskovia merdavium]MBD7981403.1 colicin transporter [Oerskovia merdavium]